MTTEGPGADLAALRARREERGWSLDEVARATRIPVAHLEAIEEGDFDALPEGPYRVGQVRAYFRHLGLVPRPGLLAEIAGRGEPEPEPSRVPLWTVRIGAGALSLVLLGLLVVQVARSLAVPGADDTALPPVNAPDQVVRVVARRTTDLRILVDGEVVLDRELPGGEEVEVAGHRRVEVHLEGADRARVEYNGDPIVPQGRQDVPRRLVFIDDLDPGNGP